ncbi:8935_t:CDS:2 [Paraglomus occultum]|uniref:8935_t:CDS:1 n=1 Tax=Paraglomus occultum TaxID=144539 RepID=A0A9N8VN58_9GLOM|nr:8935_t:CDS:2 [Paraglomus occultum]
MISSQSDYSFLQRAVAGYFLLPWAALHIYSVDKFEALRWHRIRHGEIKSLMTILFFICLFLITLYDSIASYLKYKEGFILLPNGQALAKPGILWSEKDMRLSNMDTYLLMTYFAIENAGLFLLQNFWNYLTGTIVQKNFIASTHFKVNYGFALVAIVIFPLIPFVFQYNELLALVLPRLFAVTCNIPIILYGIRAHFKFSQFINESKGVLDGQLITSKLVYYRDMNTRFMTCIALGTISFFILSVDGLTPEKTLNSNKFISDLFANIANLAHTLDWIILILVFYPSKHFNLIPASTTTIRVVIDGDNNTSATTLPVLNKVIDDKYSLAEISNEKEIKTDAHLSNYSSFSL